MKKRAPAWRRYLRFGGADVHSDVDDELAFHLEIVAAAYVAEGDSPERAMRRAREEFGDLDRARSQCYRIGERRQRRSDRGELFAALSQDLRYSTRSLLASPAFTIGVTAMMALAIAANAAMFAVLDRMFVRAPSFLRAPATVHRVYEGSHLFAERDGLAPATSYPRYLDLRRFTHAFSELAAVNERELVVADGGRSELTRVERVSGSFWRIFDVRPVIGVLPIAADDGSESQTHVAVLNYDYWKSRFGADSSVIGRVFTIGGRSYRVIGVAPRGFHGISDNSPALFVPLEPAPPDMFVYGGASSLTSEYSSAWVEVIARRKRGWSVAAATADVDAALKQSLHRQRELGAMPASGLDAATMSITRGELGPVLRQQGPLRTDEARVALWLGGVAATVLLIAALNVANLMLARTLRRQREIAVRVALGATIGRLVRLLLAEATLLMTAGTALGLAALWWFGETAREALLPNVSLPQVGLDARVVLFAVVSGAVVAAIIALAPAVHALRWNVASAINESSRSGSLRRSRLRALLLVTQAALSLTLCVTAGLFVRSLVNVRALPLGYDPRHVVTLTPVTAAVGSPSAVDVAHALFSRARSLDGVSTAAEAISLPFTLSMIRRIAVPGADPPTSERLAVLYNGVSPDYFRTVNTRMVAGRAFTDADSAGAPRVVIVSAPMAARLWPNRVAVGQCLGFGQYGNECIRVVGVAEGTRHWTYQRDAMLDYYVPVAQAHPSAVSILLRTTEDARYAVEGIRRRLQPLVPAGVVLKVAPMQDALDKAAAPWRVGATMLSIFALLALLVATLGVYATASYDLTEREHEIGIRLALGATGRDLLRATVARGIGFAALGVVAGSLVSFGVGSVVAGLLFGVSSRDPETFLVAAAAIVLAFIAASGAPALRAARADPSLILRSG